MPWPGWATSRPEHSEGHGRQAVRGFRRAPTSRGSGRGTAPAAHSTQLRLDAPQRRFRPWLARSCFLLAGLAVAVLGVFAGLRMMAMRVVRPTTAALTPPAPSWFP